MRTIGANSLNVCGAPAGCHEPHIDQYAAIIEKCPDTGLYVGNVPGFSGAQPR